MNEQDRSLGGSSVPRDGLITTRSAALAAAVGVSYWVVTLLGLTIVNGTAYDSLRQPGSELALGRYGWAMDLAFFVLGIGVAGLGLAMRRALGAGSLSWLLGLVGLFLFLSGIFPTELGSGTRPSLHNALGLGAFLLTIVVMFRASRLFRWHARWQRMAVPSLVWSILALLAFFLVPVLGESLLGLAQRIFVATVFSWYLVVAVRMYRYSREESPSADGAPAAVGA